MRRSTRQSSRLESQQKEQEKPKPSEAGGTTESEKSDIDKKTDPDYNSISLDKTPDKTDQEETEEKKENH